MPRGQAMVETAMVLPLLLLIVLGALEFGFVFDHNLTLEYATREGARVGSELAHGTTQVPCGFPGNSPVDNYIVAAVERVLESPGSPVDADQIGEVRIYKANASGQEAGPVNVWTYAAGLGPNVDGANLDFKPVLSQQSWNACSRDNSGTNPDYVGVSLTYTYHLKTPLGSILRMVTIPMRDRTVMQLNPTTQ